jgi:hypothetical protein
MFQPGRAAAAMFEILIAGKQNGSCSDNGYGHSLPYQDFAAANTQYDTHFERLT